ncbi:hypothetical protein J6590_030304 [Homalodisca vitripennis]|nr:hypothetical protein J6590_030304 [Homalodisca vitripennis]
MKKASGEIDYKYYVQHCNGRYCVRASKQVATKTGTAFISMLAVPAIYTVPCNFTNFVTRAVTVHEFCVCTTCVETPSLPTIVQDIVQSSKVPINYRLSPYTSVASVLPVSRPPAYPQSYKISYNRPRFLLVTGCHRTRVLRLYYLCRDPQLTQNRTRYLTIV